MEMYEDVLFYPDFEEALIGIVNSCGYEEVAVYSIEKCYEILMAVEDWSYEEAVEYFDYNYIGFFMGEKHPIFVQTELFDLKTLLFNEI